MKRFHKFVAMLIAGSLLAPLAGAQASVPVPRKGSWNTIQDLPEGTVLRVKSALADGGTHTVKCQFRSADEIALTCEPWSRPRPYWAPRRATLDEYVLPRAQVLEVRLDDEDAQRAGSTAIGTLAGGVIGGVIGYNCCSKGGDVRAGGAIGMSLIGALVGGVAGHAMPFVRGHLIYRR